MKKTLILALAIAMVFAMPVTAFASTFNGSPSNNTAPTVGDTTVTNKDWDGKIEVESYADRKDLSAEEQKEIEAAYDTVAKASNVTELNSGLTAIAEQNKVETKDLAVSDLFDVYATKEGMGSATITLKSESFKNFVALLHYTDGKWEIVEGATCKDDTLTFTVDSLSPFAVVVAKPGSPETGDTNGFAAGLLAFAVLSGVVGVGFLVKSKREAA